VHSLRMSILMLFMAVVLTGCEHWHNAVDSIIEAGDRKTDQSYSSATYQNTYSSGMASYGNKHVDVYDLDTPQAQDTMQQGGQQDYSQPIGRPAEGSPGVTIFSVDDEWNTQPAAPARPSLIPPSQYREGMPSPFHQGSLVNPGQAKMIYFSHGSSYINGEGKKVVRAVADQYKDGHHGVLNVVGHASKRAETSDPVQRGIVNMKMSMKRAMRVSESLIHSGVPASAIKTSAAGDAQAASYLNGKSQEAANRRVEIQSANGFAPEMKTAQNAQPTYMAREFPAGGPVTLLPLN